jgi:hypothetical protein
VHGRIAPHVAVALAVLGHDHRDRRPAAVEEVLDLEVERAAERSTSAWKKPRTSLGPV